MQLDVEAAREAIEADVAEPLGISVEEAAWQIRRLVDATMGQEIFKELALKGHDPRTFTVFAAGGAGATHAAGYAEAVGATTVMTFPFSSVFCAFGASTTDVLHIYERSRHLTVTQFMQPGFALDTDAFNGVVAQLLDEARLDFELEGYSADRLQTSLELDMRYKTQLNQTRVTVPKAFLDGDDDVQQLCDGFNEAYARQYSPEAAFPQAGIDIEEFHLKVWVPSDREPAVKHELVPGDGGAARTGERPVYWGPAGTVTTSVFDRERLVPGDAFTGPAIVESDDTTTVVPIGWHYRIDEYGNGVMERGVRADAEGTGR